jgi:hypothetical protein
MRLPKTKRRCLFDSSRNRPCDKCKCRSAALHFHDAIYRFFTVEFGEDDAITARVPPWRSFDHRLMTLGPEVAREIAARTEAIWGEAKKYGVGWTALSLASLGASEKRYNAMLANIEGKQRAACACEIANWLNGHKDDRENLKTDLNKFFKEVL